MRLVNLIICVFLFLFLFSTENFASDLRLPENPDELLSEKYVGKAYSPYAKQDFPNQLLWGDTHLHTGLSFDAGTFGNRLMPEDAYKFARGEEVVSSTGIAAKLSRPYDWLVVSDHSDNMGMFTDLAAGKKELLAVPKGKEWYDGIKQGKGGEVAYEMISMFANNKFPPELVYSPDKKEYKAVWDRIIKAAETYNEPGRFTTFIGYEWTSLVMGGNMHRNVIYRDGAEVASKMVPYTTIKPHGSINPRDLYKWMTEYEEKTGGDVLAIAHNGNLSNGIMFPIDAQYDGVKLDKKYVTERAKWEPLYEVTQMKGDGETHPFLSPDDEFADYDTWDIGNLDAPTPAIKTEDMLAGEYAREALKRGMVIEKKLGTNPYKFGMVGSTDSHTALSTAEEDNFFGKHSGAEPKPSRMGHPFLKNEKGTIMGWAMSAAGLAAVWAKENTREAIFDAMQRKEVYATTGSRIAVRFFGGWDFNKEDLNNRNPAFIGYEKGVPMGGDLKKGKRKTPTFMVYALRDPIGGNLDRIQIVKGWMDKKGKTHEKVYNVAWSNNLGKGKSERKLSKDGKIAPIGNTVVAETAHYTNTIGSSELATIWKDPDFDYKQKAFYYARVIEIPTPRWSTIEAFRFGIPIPEGAPTSTQERAYTSPIWYSPK